jgi:predicted AAA+ superfamily ATPase
LYAFVKKWLSKSKNKGWVFIDEIQAIDQWEKAIASLLSEGQTDLYITGSNATMMSSELSTLLTGRYIAMEVLPFTFKEFFQFKTLHTKESPEDLFEQYLRYGGLPGLHHLNDKDIYQEYLGSVISATLLKDVVQRHHIRDMAQLERIVQFVMDNCGNMTSAKSISDFSRSQRTPISLDTVHNYLIYLQQAYLVRIVQRYDIKGKRYLELYEKYYMGDIGLRYGYIGFRDPEISKMLENLVYLELLARGYHISVGVLGQKEIDFIAERQGERLYIQVTYLLASDDTISREFSSLESVPDAYPRWYSPKERD